MGAVPPSRSYLRDLVYCCCWNPANCSTLQSSTLSSKIIYLLKCYCCDWFRSSDSECGGSCYFAHEGGTPEHSRVIRSIFCQHASVLRFHHLKNRPPNQCRADHLTEVLAYSPIYRLLLLTGPQNLRLLPCLNVLV